MKSFGCKICVVLDGVPSLTETFIRAHVEYLPASAGFITGWWPKDELGRVYRPTLANRALYLLRAGLKSSRKMANAVAAYRKVFQARRPDVVLAEYGPTGELVAQACAELHIPLVVHFHGYDASIHRIIAENNGYQRIAQHASGVVAVSRAMERRLVEIGIPKEKLHYNTYGVAASWFGIAKPAESTATFLTLGRLVEKKAPHLTLLAFRRALETNPDLKLRMIGDGPLRPICEDLVRELSLGGSVTLLGAMKHDAVRQEIATARAFIQHSVVASDGDSEGTPVAVFESGAAGLPAISTKHAGIPDVVIHGQTGFLVDERDVAGMSRHIVEIGADAKLAAQMGTNAMNHIRENYTIEASVDRLRKILESCAAK